MKLATILNPKYIFINIEEENRRDIYLSMLTKAQSVFSIPGDAAEHIDTIIKNEDTIRIPYEKELALPHSRTTGVDDLHILIGVLAKPVQLKPNDISPTRIVIMSLISANTSDLYLLTLSATCKYLVIEANREKIYNASSANDIIQIVSDDNVEIKHSLTAEEVMSVEFPAMRKDDSIATALDIFLAENRRRLPVVDDEMHLIGELNVHDIIRRAIPEYIMMMDNLNFLNSFEPFENFFKEEDNVLVGDLMKDSNTQIRPETPLIQLTVSLIKDNSVCLFVVDDKTDILKGIITISELIKNVLRG